jgi:NaMN:DMB phosphoribosyltransferase
MKEGAAAVVYACNHSTLLCCTSNSTTSHQQQRQQQEDEQAGEGVAGPPRLAVCIGELGIGNTTAAAALLAALTGSAPEAVCGRGTGREGEGFPRTGRYCLPARSVKSGYGKLLLTVWLAS